MWHTAIYTTFVANANRPRSKRSGNELPIRACREIEGTCPRSLLVIAHSQVKLDCPRQVVGSIRIEHDVWLFVAHARWDRDVAVDERVEISAHNQAKTLHQFGWHWTCDRGSARPCLI